MGKAFHWWLSKFTHSQGYYLNRLVSSCNWSHWKYYKPIVMFFFKCDFRAEEVAPHAFLFRRKCASQNGREVAPHRFLFCQKSASQNGREVAPHRFLFRQKSASRHFCSLTSHHIRAAKGIPCAFTSPKGTPHGATRAKREHHARNMRETCEWPTFWLHSSGTALPFSSVIVVVGQSPTKRSVLSRDGHHNHIWWWLYTLQSTYGHRPSPYKPISGRPGSLVSTVTAIHMVIIWFITGMGT